MNISYIYICDKLCILRTVGELNCDGQKPFTNSYCLVLGQTSLPLECNSMLVDKVMP